MEGSDIHVDVTLILTTCLKIVSDPLMSVASFSRVMLLGTMQKWLRNHLRNVKKRVEDVDFVCRFPRSQSDCASVGCAEQQI